MSCLVFWVVFMYLERKYVNGNILQCIARYNYRFMKLTWLRRNLVRLAWWTKKNLIDILNSVMFPQPGSVSVFSSFHSLVYFLFIQVDLYNSFGSWTLRARFCRILPFKRQDNAIYYRWSGWASGNCKVSESDQVPGCVRHHLVSYTEVLPAFFSLCALV